MDRVMVEWDRDGNGWVHWENDGDDVYMSLKTYLELVDKSRDRRDLQTMIFRWAGEAEQLARAAHCGRE